MSGDLAVPDRAGADLMTWAEEARLVNQIAISLASTSFVPSSMRGKADEITSCVLTGRELGLSPMASLRSIDIIDGQPALRAMALRGLVLAAGHECWVEESTDSRAVVRGRRKGSSHVQSSIWSMDRAKKAGLAGRRNYQTHPAAMLVARATAEVCRLIGADVIMAMPYAAEELADSGSIEAAVLEPGVAPKQRKAAQRKPLAASPPVVPFRDPGSAQPLEAGPSVDEIADPPDDPMTDGMRKAIMANYRELGLTDRAARLAHASNIVGRELRSANDLSHSEAHDLLAAIEAELAHRPQKEEE